MSIIAFQPELRPELPVVWVLLRDACRTLITAIKPIRRRGLKHRIGFPDQLIRDMNKLCIEMTHKNPLHEIPSKTGLCPDLAGKPSKSA